VSPLPARARRERPEEGATLRRSDRGAVAPLVLRALPTSVPFGVLGRILGTALPIDARIEAHRLSRERSLELLERASAVAEAELASPASSGAGRDRPEVERVAASARELAQQVGVREQELWQVGLLLAARAATPARAERLRSELAGRLAGWGFRPEVPRHGVAEALAPPAASGAARRPSGYWHTVHTDGLAAFFPFVDESVVEPGGVLVGLLLDDASPVWLDRWSHASHSWGIFGTTGAGKSFAASLIALRSRWLDAGLEVIAIDPLGEFSAWARSLGGEVVDLGPAGAGRINPLDPESTGGDREEKAARVGTLLRTVFPSLRDEEAAALDRALSRLYRDGPVVPTFSDLRTAVLEEEATGRLPALLRSFTEGSLRYLDGPTTVRPEGAPLVVTLAGVPEEHLPFHLSYVLDGIYGRLRRGDRHRLLIVDEAHFLVRHPATAEFLDGVVRHVRHFGAGLLLLSQHPEDFLRSAPGRSLLRNLRATLLLRLTAVGSEVREQFQLTEAEAEWLPRARLPREAGYAEGLLRLGGAHLPIAVVASTPEYEFLTRHLGAARASAPVPGAGPTAPLSDRDRRLPPDERGAYPPGGRGERASS
jgi:conjugal transfer ATP-binding protein TraC